MEKFGCVSDFGTLTCSWHMEMDDSPYSLSHSLQYTNYKNKLKEKIDWKKCAFYNTNRSCQWTRQSDPPYLFNATTFLFLLTTHFPFKSMEQSFTVDHYEIIKPRVPQNLSVTSIMPTVISLSWSPPIFFSPKGKHLKRLEPDLDWQVIVYELSDHKTSVHDIGIERSSYHINNLFPNHYYNISVRCKTTKTIREEMWWSDFATLTVKTKSSGNFIAYFIYCCMQ